MAVSPAVKYTLARLGIFAAAAILLLPVTSISLMVRLMIAILVSGVLSWFLLRRMRDAVAQQVEQSMGKRQAEKEKLRQALAGEAENGESK